MQPSWYSLTALFFSVIALSFTIKNYLRKQGLLVRGSFGITHSRFCEDRYISRILIENLKDRAITVFAIYLRVGENYYIELENFEASPMVLKAYEPFQRQYGPIQFYGINANTIDLNSLLGNQKIRKRLVLSTSDGKYVVPEKIKHWTPVSDFFKNHLTATVHPVRLSHKGKDIGGNARFVVEINSRDGTVETVHIHKMDYEIKVFKNFALTKESLDSVDALREYLNIQSNLGIFKCKDFQVHDVDKWRVENYDFYDNERIVAKYYGLFMYHVVGRLGTWLSIRSMRKKNKNLKAVNSHEVSRKSEASSD